MRVDENWNELDDGSEEAEFKFGRRVSLDAEIKGRARRRARRVLGIESRARDEIKSARIPVATNGVLVSGGQSL